MITEYEQESVAEILQSPGGATLIQKVLFPQIRKHANRAVNAAFNGELAMSAREAGGFEALYEFFREAYAAAKLETPTWIQEKRY